MGTEFYDCSGRLCRGNVVDLSEYRLKLALEERGSTAAGLPPKRRRRHRCPLGLRLCDLVNLVMAAATIGAAGAVLSGL